MKKIFCVGIGCLMIFGLMLWIWYSGFFGKKYDLSEDGKYGFPQKGYVIAIEDDSVLVIGGIEKDDLKKDAGKIKEEYLSQFKGQRGWYYIEDKDVLEELKEKTKVKIYSSTTVDMSDPISTTATKLIIYN